MKPSPLFISRGPVAWPVGAHVYTHTPSVCNDRSLSYCIALQSPEWSLDERKSKWEGERPVLLASIWSQTFGCAFGWGLRGQGRVD